MNVTMSSVSGSLQEDRHSEFSHPHDEESEEGDGAFPDVAGVSWPQKSELPPSFEPVRPTGHALSNYNDLGVRIEHPVTGTSKSITGEESSLESGTITGSGEFYSADSGDEHPLPPITTPAPFPSPLRSPLAGSQTSAPAGSRIPLPTPPPSSQSPYLSPLRSPPSWFPRTIKRWKKIKRIGGGSCGTVYQALNLDDESFFALKVSREEGIDAEFQKEVEVLRLLRHPNIVQYLGTVEDNGCPCICMELMQDSLKSIIPHLDETLISTCTRQILQGLVYLHGKNTVHRDIKCANILVDRHGQVKLADFGFAKEVGISPELSCKGTACFMAPEILKPPEQRRYGLSVDIWSLGCTVLEMADGKPPWSFLEALNLFEKVKKGELPPIPQHLSQSCQDFIKRCLQFRPEDRPTASELLDDPFVANPPPMAAAAAFIFPSPSAYMGAEILSGEEKLADAAYQRSTRKRRMNDAVKTPRDAEDVDVTKEVQKPQRIFLFGFFFFTRFSFL